MRKSLTVGILPELKNLWERRAPLTPEDVHWLVQRKIAVEIVGNSLRVFRNEAYKKAGAKIVSHFNKASLLLGVKEPEPKDLLANKIYMIFSHTTKGQHHNKLLIRTALKKKITLIDYEHIVNAHDERLVYFGRFAGVCGMIDCLHYLGRRYEAQGIKTKWLQVRRSLDYGNLGRAERHLRSVAREIKKHGFKNELTPFVIGILGHGNVSSGVQEILSYFKPIEIHPRDMLTFIKHQRKRSKQVYKIVFNREEKFRSKDKKGFYFEEYLKHPKRFESNLDRYLPYINLLINTSYWDRRYPRLVPEKMLQRLSRKKNQFRLGLIGDLSCDVRGSIEITKKTTTPGNPVFTYDLTKKKVKDGVVGPGVSVLAVDNLPCEFPKDASQEFSAQIRDYVYQIAAHGVKDITEHAVLPRETREAVVVQGGKLTKRFRYMKRFL